MPNDAPEQVLEVQDSPSESSQKNFADELDPRNATSTIEPFTPAFLDADSFQGDTSQFNGDSLEGTAFSGDFSAGLNETFEGKYKFDSFSYNEALEQAARSGKPVVIGIGSPG